jgi:hypothetical protein
VRQNLIKTARFSQAFLCFLLVTVSAYSNAAWQVTKFEVFQGAPVESADWQDEESEDFFKSLSADNVDKTEKFMQEVAERLSGLGFADPLAKGYFDSLVTNIWGQSKNFSFGWFLGFGFGPCLR